MLRDLRINRIFEGSSEIMQLLIAREAVDQHLQSPASSSKVTGTQAKANAAVQAGRFYTRWLPQLTVGDGSEPALLRRVRIARLSPKVRRTLLPQARPLHVLRA